MAARRILISGVASSMGIALARRLRDELAEAVRAQIQAKVLQDLVEREAAFV